MQGDSQNRSKFQVGDLGIAPELRTQFTDAVEHYRAGQLVEAERLCRDLLQSLPDIAAVHNTLGVILRAQKKLEESVTAYREALRIAPSDAAVHSNLCNALTDLKRFDEAVDAGRRAVTLDPNNPTYHGNLGKVFENKGEHGNAVGPYRRAVELDPGCLRYIDLGAALFHLGEFAAAEENFRNAIAKDPQNALAYTNLGNTLLTQGKAEEAEHCYRTVTRLTPDVPKAYLNVGLLRIGKGDLQEAEEYFLKALEIDPQYPEGHVGLAFAHFLSGNFKEAAPHYEFRRKLDMFKSYKVDVPEWEGQVLTGKTIVLCNEQGLGDTIQFARYAPLVRALGCRVAISCQRELARLFRASPLFDWVVVESEPPPRCNWMIPMLSLMRVMGTTVESIPAAVPYLQVVPQDLPAWRERVGAGKWRVGIVWAGRREHPNDRNRSIPLATLAPLFNLEGMAFFSLQVGAQAAEREGFEFKDRITDLAPFLKDFADTAAAMECLDLIISVDTAAVHLAGALGRPVWTLLPFAPDWRWMLGREDSPWYPGMRLFRQPRAGDWESVLARVARALMECRGKLT